MDKLCEIRLTYFTYW